MASNTTATATATATTTTNVSVGVGYPNGIGIGIEIGAGTGTGTGAASVARAVRGLETTTSATATTIVRYDYIFDRDSYWIRSFFAVIYLSSNLISAVCLVLLLRFYFSKTYHKVHEKNLNSTCLSLLAINVLKWANVLCKTRLVNEMLMQLNAITTFLLLTTAADLYLTLKSVIKDIFVEEAASRRRFAVYSLCGWLLPFVVLRLLVAIQLEYAYSPRDFAFALAQLHCCVNFAAVALVHAGGGGIGANHAVEGYKYYSDEKYTSNVVCFLSSMRFVFHLAFLVTRKHVALSVLDYFRAYEGMYIYYCLAIERAKKCARTTCTYERQPTVGQRYQHRHLERSSGQSGQAGQAGQACTTTV